MNFPLIIYSEEVTFNINYLALMIKKIESWFYTQVQKLYRVKGNL